MKKIIASIIFLVAEIAVSQTIQNNPYGLKIPSQEYLDSLPKQKFIPARPLVIGNSRDLSSWMPIPGNQGTQGSCVAWTIGYGLKSYQERVEENNMNLVFSPAFIFNSAKGLSGRCDEGIFFYEGFDILRIKGICELVDMPYKEQECNNGPTLSAQRKANRYKIQDWKTIYASENSPISDIYPIKHELFQGNPVAVAVWLDSNIARFLDDARPNKPKYVWRNPLNDTSKKYYYHALLCVGYNDNNREFKLLNSYGPNSGNSGYVYISYDAFKRAVYEAYFAIDLDNHRRLVAATRPKPTDPGFGVLESAAGFNGWLKKGYFIQINQGLKLSCVDLKGSDKNVIFKLYDTTSSEDRLIGSYELNEGDKYEITYDNKTYNLFLDKIGNAGINIFKQAAFIEFSAIE
ncbi:C1 family peptidase [Flagellimonas flava]|uniref:C1 family peptidase n=1 Tax=Flagellimonas flava TaxID=570519 RepID=UPI003D649F21